ncbi:hypothetical protein VNO80_22567 [Phaseolus coccineus]|uniref:Uncharacterized protein n=1 Tax=Phaseolus coccineus TaxID=3886 RepID=A0AAN9QUE1_PHACN
MKRFPNGSLWLEYVYASFQSLCIVNTMSCVDGVGAEGERGSDDGATVGGIAEDEDELEHDINYKRRW